MSASQSAQTGFRAWIPVIGLAFAAFVFNTSEFLPVGLLPGITPQRLKEAMQKGDISIALEKMPEKDAKKLKSILGNPELIKKMMKSAQAQELKKSMKNQ